MNTVTDRLQLQAERDQRACAAGHSTRLYEDENGWFCFYNGLNIRSAFQSIVSVAHRRVVGHEALMRPRTAAGVAVAPIDLFRTAEDIDDQMRLDQMSRAVHVKNFSVADAADPSARWLMLNVEPSVFTSGLAQGDALPTLIHTLDAPPERVVLELLEHRSVDDDLFEAAAKAYRDQGFLLAIDDFGAGQSNFDRVGLIRPDIVKLDRALVAGAEANPVNRRILRHMVGLLHQTGAMVIAEGVETLEQALIMMESDVDFLQGFWLGRPVAAMCEASRQFAVDQMDRAWAQFGAYEARQAQERRAELEPFRSTLRAARSAYVRTRNLKDAARVFFSVPGSLAMVLLDERGIQTEPSMFNPQESGVRSLSPLQPGVGGNWSRRGYFKRAVENPGRVVVVGPHRSLSYGLDCFTGAIAIPTPRGCHVLCAEFV